MSLAIYGGTFNPVHVGHLIAAQDVLDLTRWNSLSFMPVSLPPHKTAEGVLPAVKRLAMLRLAIAGDSRLSVADEEIRLGGQSFTWRTVQRLQEKGAEDIYWLIGADMLPDLLQWRNIAELMDAVKFVIMRRPKENIDLGLAKIAAVNQSWADKLRSNSLTTRLVEISSSEIRARVAAGKSIRYLVPPAVEKYIQDNSLYQGSK